MTDLSVAMLKCSISAADPGPGAAFSEFPAGSRLSVTGLCSTSFCSRSTSAFIVALMSMHWQPLGTCAGPQYSVTSIHVIYGLHNSLLKRYIQQIALMGFPESPRRHLGKLDLICGDSQALPKMTSPDLFCWQDYMQRAHLQAFKEP